MNKTIIRCKTTAPMFMAGANTWTPELRAASIKGCMRFIWRAIQRADKIEELQEKEGALFGNACGGKKTRQSAMRIRVDTTLILNDRINFSIPCVNRARNAALLKYLFSLFK